MIGTLEQSLFRLQISQFWLDALLGLLILLAVASDTLILRRLRAIWARTELRLVPQGSPEAGARPVVGGNAQARSSAGSVLKGG
jgi:rhamnose transport system permease protein